MKFYKLRPDCVVLNVGDFLGFKVCYLINIKKANFDQLFVKVPADEQHTA